MPPGGRTPLSTCAPGFRVRRAVCRPAQRGPDDRTACFITPGAPFSPAAGAQPAICAATNRHEIAPVRSAAKTTFVMLFSHVINPFVARAGSEHEFAQRVTWTALERALDEGRKANVEVELLGAGYVCLLYTSPSPRDS